MVPVALEVRAALEDADPKLISMKNILLFICLFLLTAACDSYAPYPVLADEDALLKLECTVGEADSTVVYVSKEYLITYDHRPSDTDSEPLNSSLKFTVNGEELECIKYINEGGDRYVVHYVAHSGDVVEVFCSAPGVPDATAETVVPEAPADLVKDFNYTVEDNTLKGRLALNGSQTGSLYLSADLDITNVIHKYEYEDDVYIGSRSFHLSDPLSVKGIGEWIIDYRLPREYIGIDDEGRMIREIIDTEIRFNLKISSEELYFATLHQQSSSMSPSSYTNVKGGLGYVGAMKVLTLDIYISEAQ